MPSRSKMLPVLLFTALLAGCVSSGVALRAAGGDGGTSGDPQPSSGPSSAPPSGQPSDALTGDTPPSGADNTIPTPTFTDRVPQRCLFSAAWVISVVNGTVKLDLQAGVETSGFDELSGAHSTCRMGLTSTFPSQGGIDVAGGHVTVSVQSRGSDIYFPPRPGDTEVDNLGDGAIQRNGRLYVLVGTYVYTVEVAITTAGTPEQTHARDFDWEKKLAAMILG